ncbi:MAG: hypothetical protein GC200_01245 [Tepidisphaera sp.]|nr:hypothetical protein [Tepidisphaera sp.]
MQFRWIAILVGTVALAAATLGLRSAFAHATLEPVAAASISQGSITETSNTESDDCCGSACCACCRDNHADSSNTQTPETDAVASQNNSCNLQGCPGGRAGGGPLPLIPNRDSAGVSLATAMARSWATGEMTPPAMPWRTGVSRPAPSRPSGAALIAFINARLT